MRRTLRVLRWACAGLLLSCIGVRVARMMDIHSESAVRIYTAGQNADYHEPWKPGSVFELQGGGCIVQGSRILTTAHMVNKATYIEVKKFDETRKYIAKVEQVNTDLDLALLSVQDPDFFVGTKPATLGDLPSRGNNLLIQGGDKLAMGNTTAIAVSMVRDLESNRRVPAVLTNPAIDAANNGCAAFYDGKLVGIAFDASEQPDKTGTLIPAPVIARFFKGVQADRVPDKLPDLGFFTQDFDSPALKTHFKVQHGVFGAVVDKVILGGSADGILKDGDVITSLDGHAVDDAGFVKLDGVGRISMDYLPVFHFVGESIKLGILRAGRALSLGMPLKPKSALLARRDDERHPAYFMAAGLVFVPLSEKYCAEGNWQSFKPAIQDLYYHGLPSENRKQVVILSHVLPAEINIGYGRVRDAIVTKVNGFPITQLSDLAPAFGKPVDGYDIIELGDHDWFGTKIVLDAGKALSATAEIMKVFKMQSDRAAGI